MVFWIQFKRTIKRKSGLQKKKKNLIFDEIEMKSSSSSPVWFQYSVG